MVINDCLDGNAAFCLLSGAIWRLLRSSACLIHPVPVEGTLLFTLLRFTEHSNYNYTKVISIYGILCHQISVPDWSVQQFKKKKATADGGRLFLIKLTFY